MGIAVGKTLTLGGRPVSKILGSAFQRQHYSALWNMYRNYYAPLEVLRRYLSGKGEYPCKVRVKTPTGDASPVLYSHHDLLTVNEIFCRLDYLATESVKVVVDLGSNVGISALYFLSRNQRSRCYLFEPDPRNTEKLKLNLAGFESRYSLQEDAVSDTSGTLQFGIESTGRYGGLGLDTGEYIKVNCLDINEVLREILANEQTIDILKIDTEGVEIQTVEAIEKDLLRRIRKIYLEAAPPEEALHPELFEQRQYGSICQLTNRTLRS